MPNRTLRHARPVTYTCPWCEREHTELRYPGPPPRYCPACKPLARAAAARARYLQALARPAGEWPRHRNR